jgi:AcrR family transcriptional regulator
MTTPVGSQTRQKLVDAATRSFAEHGVENASLLEIARQAGQRNRGAVHYHFGSREGLLVAVLAQYAAALNQRHSELIDSARDGDLAAVLRILVVPAAELADDGWRGRSFLVVVSDLASSDIDRLDPQVRAVLSETGGEPIYELISARMPPDLPEDVRSERLTLLTTFVLRSLADRSRNLERGENGRTELPTERFIDNLVAMAEGMLKAPL